jgi:hypothetical protein
VAAFIGTRDGCAPERVDGASALEVEELRHPRLVAAIDQARA